MCATCIVNDAPMLGLLASCICGAAAGGIGILVVSELAPGPQKARFGMEKSPVVESRS